jgi:hypothetical protein
MAALVTVAGFAPVRAAGGGEAPEPSPEVPEPVDPPTIPDPPATPNTPDLPPVPPLILGEAETRRTDRPGGPRSGAAVRREIDDGGELVRVRPRGADPTYHGHGGAEVVRFGESVEVAQDDRIRGAVVVVDGDVYIDGEVEGDVVALGGNVEVTGHVTGSVVAIWGWVELDPEAAVGGDVVAIGGRVDENGAEIGGDAVELAFFGDMMGFPGVATILAARAVLTLLPFGLFLLLLAVAFGPGSRGMAREAVRRPLHSLGVGLLAQALVSLGIFVLSVTLVGIPVALLVAAAQWIGSQVALVVGAVWLGRTLGGRARSESVVRAALASAVLLLLTLGAGAVALGSGSGPIRIGGGVLFLLGSLAEIVLVLVGTGALVTTRFGERVPTQDEPIPHVGSVPQAEAAGRAS